MRRLALVLLLCAPLLLAGCDMLGIESASAIAARKDADGRAVGGGCRYSGRAIEDCYAQNRRADKAAIFAGWREMNDYMRENKIDTAPVQSAAAEAAGEPAEGATSKPADSATSKPADSAASKPGAAPAKSS